MGLPAHPRGTPPTGHPPLEGRHRRYPAAQWPPPVAAEKRIELAAVSCPQRPQNDPRAQKVRFLGISCLCRVRIDFSLSDGYAPAMFWHTVLILLSPFYVLIGRLLRDDRDRRLLALQQQLLILQRQSRPRRPQLSRGEKLGLILSSLAMAKRSAQDQSRGRSTGPAHCPGESPHGVRSGASVPCEKRVWIELSF